MDAPGVTVQDLATRLASGSTAVEGPVVLDIREAWEREIATLPESVHIPMEQVPERLEELRTLQGDRDLIVHCHSGKRSALIVCLLQQNGFSRVLNLDGGIEAWALAVDSGMKRY